MKKVSILFISMMMAAGMAQAGGVGDAMKLLGAAAAGGANGSVTVGVLGKDTEVDAQATAEGKDSEAMAGGVVSATPKGDGIKAKITVGVLDGAKVNANATAVGQGSGAYAGGVVSK